MRLKRMTSILFAGILAFLPVLHVSASISIDNSDYTEQLTEDIILKDKMKNEKIDIDNKSNQDKQIDIAYQNMMEEENYVVDLINSRGENTDFYNWEYNLKFLQDNYDSICTLENVNIKYVDTYIERYVYTLKSMQQPSERTNFVTPYADYNFTNAKNYALKYIQNYNTNYPDWSSYGDCANFVSQCLYAGGKSMKGSPGTSASATNWNNWFSKGTSQSTVNVSSTWRGAAAFRDYWQTNSTRYKKFTSMNSTTYNYGFTGDAISLLNANGAAYHTLIIVGYAGTDFEIAAHSDGFVSNGKPYRLSERTLSNGFIIYNMR